MDKLPLELLDIIVKNFTIKDLQSFCKSSKKFKDYCQSNKKLLINKLKVGNDYKDLTFLFVNKKEFYKYFKKELLELLDEDYPVNQRDSMLRIFGEHVSYNWEEYIKTNPKIVLLWYVHTLKKPTHSTLQKFFSKVPKSIIKEILYEGEDWFNTTNKKSSNFVVDYLK